MATAAVIRQNVRDMAYSATPPERPFAHQINGAVADGTTTTVTVDAGTNFAAGDIIEFQDDGEQAYIVSIATNVLTVIRGYNGTTGAAHADNTVIFKNPRFTFKQIDEAVDEVLTELEAHGVHAWGTGSITLVTGDWTYVLSADVLDVVSVYYSEASYGISIPLPFRFHRYLHTTVASGPVLELSHWGEQVPDDDVFYSYKQKIDSTDDLIARQEQIVLVGATSKLLRRRVAPFTQDPGKRTNRTVQPGQMGRDSREMLAEYVRLIRSEAATLAYEAQSLFPNSIRTSRARRWRN